MILAMAGQGVSILGTNLYNFAISFYILKVTGSATNFALSLILSTLPRVLINPFVGNIIDRTNKKLVVVAADFICGLIMISLFLMTSQQNLALWMIYSASVLLNISFVFLNNAYSAALFNIVGSKYITKVNSFNQSIVAIIQIIAPIAGGAIYALVDIRMFILANAASFFVSSLSETFIDFELHSKMKQVGAKAESFFASMKAGIKYCLEQKAHLNLAIYALFLNFFMSAFSVIMPYTLVNIHHYESSLVGMIEAAFPVGMLIASLIIGMINLKFSRKYFAGGIVAMALALVAFSLPAMDFWTHTGVTPFFYGAVFMVMAGTAVSINVPLGVRFQTTVAEDYRGRFFGLLSTMSEGIVPLSFLLNGLLINWLPTYILLNIQAIALILISFHIRGNKKLDMDTQVEAEEVVEIV